MINLEQMMDEAVYEVAMKHMDPKIVKAVFKEPLVQQTPKFKVIRAGGK